MIAVSMVTTTLIKDAYVSDHLKKFLNVCVFEIACSCNVNGSTGIECDQVTGACPCTVGSYGRDCSSCPDDTHNIEEGCISRLHFSLLIIYYDTGCPSCFDQLHIDFNLTISQLESLVIAINKTLVTTEIDSRLRSLLQELHFQLLDMTELQRNLSLRVNNLWRRLPAVGSELRQKQKEAMDFSIQTREAHRSAISLDDNTVTNQVIIAHFLNQIMSVDTTLNTYVKPNFTSAIQLVNRTSSIIAILMEITKSVEQAALDQSETVKDLVRETFLLVDNTTDLLLTMCEILELENSTLDLLRGLSDCSARELDVLMREGSSHLSAAAGNTSRVSNETITSYNRVLELEFRSDSSNLLNQSIEALLNANGVYNESLKVSSISVRLRENFTRLYLEAQGLFTRAEDLNRTANDLLERENLAKSIASSSVTEGENVISEIEKLLERLERELEDVLDFFDRLTRLTRIVEEAERISNVTLSQSLETRQKLISITNTVTLSENLLDRTIRELMKSIEVRGHTLTI